MTAQLVARLEGASEGSSELDVAVYAHVEGMAEALAELRWQAYAPVTTSLDAALALAERVLPRWGFDIGQPARMGEHGGQPWADCWPPVEDGETRAFKLGGPRPTPRHSNAPTPALALCIAILRAQPQPDGEKT